MTPLPYFAIWVLPPAMKAVKPITTPSTTSMAVRGLWREAWNGVQCTCCTGHRVPLLLVRQGFVLVGWYVPRYESQAEDRPKCRTGT